MAVVNWETLQSSRVRLTKRRRQLLAGVIAAGGLLLGPAASQVLGSGPQQFQKVVVRPGDTLWSIATSTGADDVRAEIDSIITLNHLGDGVIYPGQKLQLPN